MLSLVSHPALAIDSGRVVFTVGDPVVTNSQGSRNLAKGDDVGSGDTILTQSGIVQIQFADKSFMSLKPDTEFVIDSYNYDADDNTTQDSQYRLNFGEIRTVSGLIGKTNQKDYAIETPVATIGIRGTAFKVALLKVPTKKGQFSDFNNKLFSYSVLVAMGESGGVVITFKDESTVELGPKTVAEYMSVAGTEVLFKDVVGFVELFGSTKTQAELGKFFEKIKSSGYDDLPIALEKLNNEEGVNQIILDSECDAMCQSMAMGGGSPP